MIKYLIILLAGGLYISGNINSRDITEENQTVSQLESKLGADFTAKKPNFTIKGVSVEAGRTIINEGFAIKSNGKKTRKQSKHFVCTSCHNTLREDPNLAITDPQARLNYTFSKGMPYLQGTTLYGAVNRETYYNGDYDKKYGELVKLARNDIRGAIQLCATECAQGRKLKEWELESVLAYLWELELKTSDLNLNDTELISDEKTNDQRLALVKSKYLSGAPATFIPPPADRKAGTGLNGNIKNGEKIYEASCLHCHKNGRYSYLHLDKSSMSLNFLKKDIKKFTNHSIYQVTRWGVPTLAGKKSYMPQYTKEKLSDQQLSDLVAYIQN